MKGNFRICPKRTEKADTLSRKGSYAFDVTGFASKFDIKNFFKKHFQVEIASVRTCNYKSTTKYYRGQKGATKKFKCVYITLAKGFSLDINNISSTSSNA